MLQYCVPTYKFHPILNPTLHGQIVVMLTVIYDSETWNTLDVFISGIYMES